MFSTEFEYNFKTIINASYSVTNDNKLVRSSSKLTASKDSKEVRSLDINANILNIYNCNI